MLGDTRISRPISRRLQELDFPGLLAQNGLELQTNYLWVSSIARETFTLIAHTENFDRQDHEDRPTRHRREVVVYNFCTSCAIMSKKSVGYVVERKDVRSVEAWCGVMYELHVIVYYYLLQENEESEMQVSGRMV